MSEIPSARRAVRFGEFEADLQAGCLFRQGVKIRLREQVFVALSVLLEHAGEVVSREQLQRRLWPGDVFVDFELNLNTVISRLREALGDSAENPRYIETLPKRGYRFLAAVSEGPAHGPAPQRQVRIVVLPFGNVSNDPAEEYFSDAMTDELITALCQIAPGHLAVIARTTAMHYRHSKKDVARIGRELGVDYVVEGGVCRSGDRVAINIQLIQASDQTHIFARKYDTEMRAIFNTVNGAAADIVGHVVVPTAPEDGRAGKPVRSPAPRKPTESLAAYNEYIQARYEMGKGTPEGFMAAGHHLKKAIAHDPGFALAYDAMAELNWLVGYLGYIPPLKAFSDGILQALRAIEIDNTRAETHALLGAFHKTIEYNWQEVHREMAVALQLDPASPLVRLRYAISELMPHGCLDDAISETKRALDSDPLSLLTQLWLGILLVLARKWDQALDQGRLLLELYPAEFWGHFVNGVAYRGKRMFEEAITAMRAALEASGGAAAMAGWLGLTLGLGGEAAEARSLLDRLHAEEQQGYVPPTAFAWIHLGLGEIGPAFEWLERAVDGCDQFMMPIKSYEFFDPIRSDPRFDALVRKMNLEP